MLSGQGYLPVTVVTEDPVAFGDVIYADVDPDGRIVISAEGDQAEDFIDGLANEPSRAIAYVAALVTGNAARVYGDQINEEDGTAVITAADFKRAYGDQISGYKRLTIKSRGFEAEYAYVSLPYIYAEDGDDGSTVVVAVPKTYHVDSEEDTVWDILDEDGFSVDEDIVEYTSD